MAIFQLGSILKARREELGLSQEDLADGICSVPTLSRIENGERLPTKNHFEMLMQRLGYSAMSMDFFTDKKDFLIYELKFKTRQAFMNGDFSRANILLDELEAILDNPTEIDRQFILVHRILYGEKELPQEEKLKQLETAIQLTCPKYKHNYIPRVLSYEEIIILNNIAICYNALGDRDRTISILTELKEYYDRHVISVEEALRTQPMILYNLSKFLGLSGRYDECIEICDQGIRLARVTGRCQCLAKTLFNRAWSLIMRNHAGDQEAAEISMRQAYHVADAMGETEDAEFIRNYYLQAFSKNIKHDITE